MNSYLKIDYAIYFFLHFDFDMRLFFRMLGLGYLANMAQGRHVKSVFARCWAFIVLQSIGTLCPLVVAVKVNYGGTEK